MKDRWSLAPLVLAGAGGAAAFSSAIRYGVRCVGKPTSRALGNEASLRYFRAVLAHLSTSEELSTMKGILVGLAILAVSTSAALAAHQTHHKHMMKPQASAAAATPVIWPGGDSAADHALYLKNLHDSGMKK
jgi:hypothetical protein